VGESAASASLRPNIQVRSDSVSDGVLKVGEPAPDFTLNANDGQPDSRADFRDRQSVVLYDYPKDDTPGG
jgi:peroxiredoxin